MREAMEYTPNQASEMLKIPPSTIRRYSVQYRSHLSKHATKRRRKYTEQDITILARARELLSEGNTPAQVDELLSVINPDQQSPESTIELIPSISAALTEALDTARLLRAEVDSVHATIQAHDERMSDSERKLSEIADRLQQLESAQEAPWYQKIFKRNKSPISPK